MGRRGLSAWWARSTAVVVVVYTGIAVVAVTALPVVGNETSLGRNYRDAPMLGIAEASSRSGSATP